MAAAANRRELGRYAILSPSEAAALLPGRESDNLRWLRDQRLVRRRPGTTREEVLWGEVYDRYLEGDVEQPTPAARPATLPIPASQRGKGKGG